MVPCKCQVLSPSSSSIHSNAPGAEGPDIHLTGAGYMCATHKTQVKKLDPVSLHGHVLQELHKTYFNNHDVTQTLIQSLL